MPPTRDPLSTRYDGVVYSLMLRAGAASGQRRGVLAHVASPRSEFGRLDRGGRTAHERAFTRAAYYLVFKNGGEPGRSGWSLKLTWGDELAPSSGGRLARPVIVRLFRSGKVKRGEEWMGTERQSTSTRRIDEQLPDSVDDG